MFDLQKASLWKRVSAWLFDTILLTVLIVGFSFLLSCVTGYDKQVDTMSGYYDSFGEAYGVDLTLSSAEYEALSEEARAETEKAIAAMNADDEVIFTYTYIVNLTLVIVTLGTLLAFAVLEILVPLLLGNGQTLGKKIFGIGVMQTGGIRLRTVSLFIRAILGKYTIETMVPILLVLMLLFFNIGLTGVVVLLLLGLLQIILVAATGNRSAVHDLLAGTVAVDMASQMIFESEEEKIACQKRIHAEETAKSPY